MNTLINYLDYLVRAVGHADDIRFKRSFYDQAFGAVQYQMFLHPNDEKRVQKLWEEVYRPKFEKLVYGVGDQA
jgi:hypothetical protein